MFGLNEAEYNVVKAAARKCLAEIKAECDRVGSGKKGLAFERVSGKTIDKHHKPLELIITRTKFVWLAGYLSGRYGNPEKDYE